MKFQNVRVGMVLTRKDNPEPVEVTAVSAGRKIQLARRPVRRVGGSVTFSAWLDNYQFDAAGYKEYLPSDD